MGSNSIALSEKPHAVCTPFPTQGHINPMLKLAKLLHYKGFHITFVNTEFNHKRLLRSRGPNSLDGLPTFQFEAIPDGLPPSDSNVAQDLTSLSQSISKNCLAPFKGLLSKLNSSPNCPPVTWIVSDGIMTFTLYAAQELGVPSALLETMSACAMMGLLQIPPLIEKGLLKDPSFLTNGYLDTVVDWIPGMEHIRLKDIPFFPGTTDQKDQNDITLDYFLNEIKQSRMASATIFNTFDALEHEVVDALSSSLTPVYCIGPLQLQLNQIPPDYTHLNSIKSNLWAEETECLEWLDSKEPNSVVYVNFGSHTVMTNEQLIEFAWGLANSNKIFLWVIRPDLVGGESVVVPPEFVEETKQRSLLASWCPQELVLSHPAVGVFLTHNGWNSTLDTICGGVPVICWPFFADQQMNCRLCCKEWGIGMEIEGEVKRNYVEELVRKLMEGEVGKEMRKKALEWKKLAEEATAAPNGSSILGLDNMINQVLFSSRKQD